MPLALTDAELAIVERYATPLHPRNRSRYLARVAALVADHEVGPGLLHRCCEQAQLELRRPAAEVDGRPHVGGKYGR